MRKYTISLLEITTQLLLKIGFFSDLTSKPSSKLGQNICKFQYHARKEKYKDWKRVQKIQQQLRAPSASPRNPLRSLSSLQASKLSSAQKQTRSENVQLQPGHMAVAQRVQRYVITAQIPSNTMDNTEPKQYSVCVCNPFLLNQAIIWFVNI